MTQCRSIQNSITDRKHKEFDNSKGCRYYSFGPLCPDCTISINVIDVESPTLM